MAKKFVGFKPETLQNKVLPALGYNGPMDDKSINVFLASNPAAAARMGKFTLSARRIVEGSPMQMAEGGDTTTDEEEDTTTEEQAPAQSALGSAGVMTKAITSDPRKLTVKADTAASTGTGTDITTGTGQASA